MQSVALATRILAGVFLPTSIGPWYAAGVLHTDVHPATDARFAVQYNLYFCCFIKESCRWHWLVSPRGPRLLPGLGQRHLRPGRSLLILLWKWCWPPSPPVWLQATFRAHRQHRTPTLEGAGCPFCPPLWSKDRGKPSAHKGFSLGVAKVCKTFLWTRKFWFHAIFTCHEILVLIFFYTQGFKI